MSERSEIHSFRRNFKASYHRLERRDIWGKGRFFYHLRFFRQFDVSKGKNTTTFIFPWARFSREYFIPFQELLTLIFLSPPTIWEMHIAFSSRDYMYTLYIMMLHRPGFLSISYIYARHNIGTQYFSLIFFMKGWYCAGNAWVFIITPQAIFHISRIRLFTSIPIQYIGDTCGLGARQHA